MATLRLEQLDSHLSHELQPLYAIHGDEALLALEAADAIRSRARAGGFSERVVLAAERGFHWGELGASVANLSLFGDKKLIELRLVSGKPGNDGAEAIEAFCARLPPEMRFELFEPERRHALTRRGATPALPRPGAA